MPASDSQVTVVGPNRVVLPADWNDTLTSLTDHKTPPIVFVCGAKNTGKSTLSRLIINRFLEQPACSSVSYIETDLGQPEFTPSGLVSLQEISAPVVGRPHTHLQTPATSYYIGDTSPKGAPSLYLQAIRQVVEAFRAQATPKPLIVNTHGWVVGLGESLLETILHIVKPDFIVRLRPQQKNHLNFLPDELPKTQNTNRDPVVVTLEPVSSVQALPNKSSDVARFSSFAAYFLRESAKEKIDRVGERLCAMKPYRIAARDVRLAYVGMDTGPAQNSMSALLDIFNASVVGLCCGPPSPPAIGDLLDECVGLGIVRAVDIQKEQLFVLTPLHPDTLARVNVLLLGAQRLQMEYLYSNAQMSSSSPYVCAQSIDGGGQSNKRNLKRRRLD